MDIRSLILEDKKPAETLKPSRKSAAEYSVEICSGCDFAIAKRTKKTEELFVILVSQEQYYIKKNDGSTESISPDSMAKFFSFLEEPIVVNASWISSIEKGKKFADHFCGELCSNTSLLTNAIKEGCYYMLGDTIYNSDQMQRELFRAYPQLYRSVLDICAEHINCTRTEFIQRYYGNRGVYGKYDALFTSFKTLIKFTEKFGLEKGRALASSYIASQAVTIIPEHSLEKLLARCRFEPDRIIEYMTFDLCRQGFADDMRDAGWTWEDVLNMQKIIYNKVTDKYPEHLEEMHRKLKFHDRLRKQQINEQGFADAVEKMKKLEFSPEHSPFMIICPKSKDDMFNEASQQQNCLASYVDRVASGQCMIFFMRYKKKPAQSLVTIEVYQNGSIGQVKGRNNRFPEREHMRFVEKWAGEMGLEYPR